MFTYIKQNAYSITSSGLPVYEFQLSAESDLASLPTTIDKKAFAECVAAGSIAYTPGLAKIYSLSAAGVWTEID